MNNHNITKAEVHKLWLDMLYTINEVAKMIVYNSEGLCKALESMQNVTDDNIYDNDIFCAFKSPEMLSVKISFSKRYTIVIHIKLNKKGNTLDNIMFYMEEANRAIPFKELYNLIPTPVLFKSTASGITVVCVNLGYTKEGEKESYINIYRLIDFFNRFKNMAIDPKEWFVNPIYMVSATYNHYHK